MVRSHHGAATVSGEQFSDDHCARARMGRRRKAAIRKSGDPTVGRSTQPFVRKGGGKMQCDVWHQYAFLCAWSLSSALGVTEALSEEGKGAESIQNLETVVVTATKTPIPVSQVTSAVEVITE